FTRFGAGTVTSGALYSMLVAAVGAVAVLFIYHALANRRA
ncbi:MAG: GlsB/YeaQ/YmgE family stress response membrane protein, partial [Phenylobacterium sp.]